VEALSFTLSAFGELIRTGIVKAGEIQDHGTADILTEISRGADKNLWLVEAHAQTHYGEK
jgi:starvation-inducible DNA-binding protein